MGEISETVKSGMSFSKSGIVKGEISALMGLTGECEYFLMRISLAPVSLAPPSVYKLEGMLVSLPEGLFDEDLAPDDRGGGG